MTVATLAAPAAAAAAALSHDAALAFPGTLLAPDRTLVAPYDLEH
ncbi:TPA: ADP-heptose--LPS heptosyltransferase, partial [Burkholderia multivorans]